MELALIEGLLFLQTISIYTFLGLWMRKDVSSMKLTLAVVVCIWVFIAIIVSVGNATHHNPSYESPTPVSTHLYLHTFVSEFGLKLQYWCWISQQYLVWRIVAEYLWFWIALLFSLLVYIPLLWLRDIARDKRRQAFVFLA